MEFNHPNNTNSDLQGTYNYNYSNSNRVVPIDFNPLNQIRENNQFDTSSTGENKRRLLNNYEPLSLTPLNPTDISFVEVDKSFEPQREESKRQERIAKSTEGLVTYYEQKFQAEVLGSIENEVVEKKLNQSQMLILGEYHREYINKHFSSTKRMKHKVEKEDKVTRRKTIAHNSGALLGIVPSSAMKKTRLLLWKKLIVSNVLRLWVSILGPYTPDKMFKTLWDTIILSMVYYQLVMIPIEIAFDFYPDSDIDTTDTFAMIIFLVDILLTFNTAIFRRGLLIRSRRRIAFNYMRFWFWADLLASFPYELVFPSKSAQSYYNLLVTNESFGTFLTYFRFFQIVRLIRILKLRKLFNRLENFLDLNNTLTNIYSFLKLSLYVFLVAHWIACFWHFQGITEIPVETTTWIINYGISSEPWYNRYLAAFYFGIATMQTVGYGDILPVTTRERVITIAAMFIACGMFGYTMNKINLIISGLDNTTDLYKRSMISISNYMRQKNVRKDLQMKIKKFLEYSLNEESAVYMENNSIYSLLSETLRFELRVQVQGKVLGNLKLFKNFHSAFLAKILDIVEEKIFAPDDIICLENSGDLGMYIVSQGKVLVYRFYSNQVLKMIGRNTSFGEISFFSGQPKIASAKSSDFSSIYYIDRDAFISRLANFPEDLETFYYFKDKLLFYKDYGIANIECFECKKVGHIANNCPKNKMKRFDRDKFFREIRRNQKIFKQNFERRPRTRVFNYDKYEKLRDGADYIQRVMFDVLQKSDKPKIQRKLALKAFQGRKQLIKMNSQIIDLDTSQLNGIQPSNNDISDNDLSILMSSAATQNTKEMTTITLEKSQSNMNMLALLEAADNTQEDAFRWVEPVEEKEEEKEEDEEENGKKKKKKDPYSLTPTKKIFEDFDRVMEFKIYFTHNNLKEIVKKMNIKQGMKKKKTKV